MAQESKRGCGYRKVGGLYLCGEYVPVHCDRLPYLLDVCPVCGGGLKPSRSYTKINPAGVFGDHLVEPLYYNVGDPLQPCRDNPRCFLCVPSSEPAFIMTVGSQHYTPESFLDEAGRLGISKRIPFMPKELELGKTVVYLAHPKACPIVTLEPLMVNALPAGAMAIAEAVAGDPPVAPKIEYKFGIFTAFIPQRVEKLLWEHDATEDELAKLAKRGITPVVIKDGDMDHSGIVDERV